MTKIIAFIPCRKGSKRLPNKNILNFCGGPLYQWTIDQAIISGIISEVILSTNNLKIIEECKTIQQNPNYERLKVVERPEELATDDAKIEDAILYHLKYYPNDTIVILLQPTSPLRETEDINECIFRFSKNKECIISLFQEDDFHYKRNGAIFIDTLENLRKNKTFLPKQFYLMSKEKSIDIDTIEDFKKAEKIMKKRLENGG